MKKQTAAAFVIDQKVKLCTTLERVVQLQDKRVAAFSKQFLLKFDIAEVVFLFQVTFVKHFHSVEHRACLVKLFHQVDFSIRTLPEHTYNFYFLNVNALAEVFASLFST